MEVLCFQLFCTLQEHKTKSHLKVVTQSQIYSLPATMFSQCCFQPFSLMYTISLIKMNLPWAKLHLKTKYKVLNIKIQSPQPKKETKLIYPEKMDHSITTKFNISSNSSITDRDILQQNMTFLKNKFTIKVMKEIIHGTCSISNKSTRDWMSNESGQ